MKLLVLQGPNLHRLGQREIDIYGQKTEKDLQLLLRKKAAKLGLEIDYFQSNHEGEIIDFLYEAIDAPFPPHGIIVNLAAFSHYSMAILDALLAINLPMVEVHISNIFKREKFRHQSIIAPISIGQIVGLGFYGYESAIEFLYQHINKEA